MTDFEAFRLIPLETKPSLIVAQIGVHGHDRKIAKYYQETGLWSLHLYDYFGELHIGDEHHQIRPGSFALAPPEATLEYHLSGRSEHLYALFTTGAGKASLIPAIQFLREPTSQTKADFEALIGLGGTNPLRADIKLWDLLLRAGLPADTSQSRFHHDAVAKALQLIELRLAETISIESLADELGLSQSHLTRLFRAELGAPPVRYIANRRMEVASHLMRHTTMPIVAIAEQVGIADIHLFNKMVRRHSGASPRIFRHGKATEDSNP